MHCTCHNPRVSWTRELTRLLHVWTYTSPVCGGKRIPLWLQGQPFDACPHPPCPTTPDKRPLSTAEMLQSPGKKSTSLRGTFGHQPRNATTLKAHDMVTPRNHNTYLHTGIGPFCPCCPKHRYPSTARHSIAQDGPAKQYSERLHCSSAVHVVTNGGPIPTQGHV